MNIKIAEHLLAGIHFDLNNLMVEPKAIIMSTEFHDALDKPSEIRGISILVDDLAEQHWRLRF